jgi:long-chain fatty acid transport protein
MACIASIAERRPLRALPIALVVLAASAARPAAAGGLLLYEVGTADVGLASAGYSARAQDASTVFTNPAGMTRLAGNQLTLGAQLLYGDVNFSIASGTSPGLGSNDGGNPVGWFPGGGLFYSYSLSPDLKLGIAATGNFGLALKYDDGWAGRYYAQEATLLGVSVLPSVAYRLSDKLSLGASLNAMWGKFRTVVAVNNIVGPDGKLELDDSAWGWGGNVGLLYEAGPGTRFGVTYSSPVKLDFSAPAQWSGLGPGLTALLRSRGLLEATIDLGTTVPQGVNASFYHEVDAAWALLGSVGWQQWSKFGKVDIGVSSDDPVSLTTNLSYKDTWHVAAGAQYRISDRYTLMGGVAYDSAFQDNNQIPVALPANAQWRFGFGGQKAESKTFDWGWSVEYLYSGTLNTNVSGRPVVVGGRGDLVGSFNRAGSLFLGANFNWKL